MNPIANPGLETDDDIVLGGIGGFPVETAERRNDLGVHGGEWAGFLPATCKQDPLGPWIFRESYIDWITIPIAVDNSYAISLWVEGTLASTPDPTHFAQLYCQVDPGDGAWSAEVTADPIAGWSLWKPGYFTAVGTAARLRVGARLTNLDEEYQYTHWLVDDATMTLQLVVSEAAKMAVMLSERARKAILATLQSRLNDALSYIDLERADGMQMQPVVSWFGYRRPDNMGPELAEVQVFRRGRVEFPGWRRDINTQLTAGSCTLGSSHDFEIRLLFANRFGLSTAKMRDMGDRYEAALIRVFRDDPKLGEGEVALLDEPSIDTEFLENAADGRSWGRTVATARVNIEEDASGEGVAAGGIAPSAITEQMR